MAKCVSDIVRKFIFLPYLMKGILLKMTKSKYLYVFLHIVYKHQNRDCALYASSVEASVPSFTMFL